nr:immunoglobulin heavy chain junction region [Mus musculus]
FCARSPIYSDYAFDY